MIQLLLHLWGDYNFQSDWMANGKTSANLPALVHATVYTLPFLILTRSPLALFAIWSTHFLMDRFRLAKYVCYAKNFLAPPATFLYPDEPYDCDCGICEFCNGGAVPSRIKPKYRWENCSATGYPSETPPFMAVWLMIITDNTIHLTINYLSLRFL